MATEVQERARAAEATITIPPGHVELIRDCLLGRLDRAGEALHGEARRRDAEKIGHVLAEIEFTEATIRQIGWDGAGERTLTETPDYLAGLLNDALSYLQETMDCAPVMEDRQLARRSAESICWLTDQLDMIESARLDRDLGAARRLRGVIEAEPAAA